MPIEVSYHPGDHVLLGAGHRWLFLQASPEQADLLAELWEIATSPGQVQDRLLATIDDSLGPDVSLVWLDATPGAHSIVSRGAGRRIGPSDRQALLLDAAEPSTNGRGLRLVSGIVAASHATVEVVERDPSTSRKSAASARTSIPAATEGLIDGIPESVLGSRDSGGSPPVRPTYAAPSEPVEALDPAVPADSSDHDGHTTMHTPATDHDGQTSLHAPGQDHDGKTTFRSNQTPPPPPPAPAHLSNATHETVLAVHCPNGHTTPAATATCRVCQTEVPDQEPHQVPRPRLGALRLPDGQHIPLDRAVLFGRSPSTPDAPELGEAWPHLVRLPAETNFVSRTHLLVELQGWLVLVTDLGSRGGTTLRAPGRAPERIRAREQYVWEPGQVFDLADSYEIVYEVTP